MKNFLLLGIIIRILVVTLEGIEDACNIRKAMAGNIYV